MQALLDIGPIVRAIQRPHGRGAKPMSITRKRFLEAAAGGTILLILQACGGGGDSAPAGGGGGSSPQSCGAGDAAISGNHGHQVTIPLADLDSTVDKTYDIQGTASHDHQITLTVAQLQMLKAGQTVTVGSTTTLSHAHNVTTGCTMG